MQRIKQNVYKLLMKPQGKNPVQA